MSLEIKTLFIKDCVGFNPRATADINNLAEGSSRIQYDYRFLAPMCLHLKNVVSNTDFLTPTFGLK